MDQKLRIMEKKMETTIVGYIGNLGYRIWVIWVCYYYGHIQNHRVAVFVNMVVSMTRGTQYRSQNTPIYRDPCKEPLKWETPTRTVIHEMLLKSLQCG